MHYPSIVLRKMKRIEAKKIDYLKKYYRQDNWQFATEIHIIFVVFFSHQIFTKWFDVVDVDDGMPTESTF